MLAMWECVASRANLDLPGRDNVPRVRVGPGGGALAELVAALWNDKVPGVAVRALASACDCSSLTMYI